MKQFFESKRYINVELRNVYMHIGVIGSGKFGLVLANLYLQKHTVSIYVFEKKTLFSLKKTYPKIQFVTKLDNLRQCDIVFIATPAKALESITQKFQPTKNQKLILACKGLSQKGLLPCDVFSKNQTYFLSGPMIAQTLDKKFKAIVAGTNAQQIAKKLSQPQFNLEPSTHKKQMQLIAIFKNVLAYIHGKSLYANCSENIQGLFITKCIFEYAKHHKLPQTVLYSPAGLGDIFATILSPSSRNKLVGMHKKTNQTVESAHILKYSLKYFPNKLAKLCIALHSSKNKQKITNLIGEFSLE